MSKHMPGPWYIHELGQHWNNPSLKHIEICYGKDGECICDTVYEEADAHLIAAAPQMLHALNVAYVALATHGELKADKIIRDAIKAAEGDDAKADTATRKGSDEKPIDAKVNA